MEFAIFPISHRPGAIPAVFLHPAFSQKPATNFRKKQNLRSCPNRAITAGPGNRSIRINPKETDFMLASTLDDAYFLGLL